ncbi:MAG TPA: TldD/PmbA family protein [Acidimicrobiales bacterium]|nr:TldD/PmbA family protein [Acidimicrobiales bacterium]
MIEETTLRRVLTRALQTGGEFAEVFAEDKRTTAAMLDDGRVEDMTSGRDRGAGIRVVVGETTGFAHTADLSEASLMGAAEAAAAAARSGGGGTREVSFGPRTQGHGGRQETLVDPGSMTKTNKVALLEAADHAARSAGGAIRQVSAGYADSRRRILVANSDGLLAEDDQVRTRMAVTCVATGDTGMQTGFDVRARTGGFEMFDAVSAEAIALEAARRAILKLSARPAPSGVLPVVVKSGSGGMLFHEACGHGLEADAILKDSSVYAGRVGQQVASELVTLVDDGTMAGEWGAFAVDDEGHAASRNVLIENGVLTDYMWDFLRARKEKRPVSANGRRQSYEHLPMVRMTNTYLLSGTEDPEEIINQTKLGVYVARLGGGSVNTATGDFVFGMTEAYMIENGEITDPIRDANLIGNGPDILGRIDAVADDFDMCPGTCGKDGQQVPVGCGQPTLRVSGMTVGGTAGD